MLLIFVIKPFILQFLFVNDFANLNSKSLREEKVTMMRHYIRVYSQINLFEN